MKKFFFFAVALACTAFAQAQKIVDFGFEDADKGKSYHCQYALTPRPDGLGDWVNVHEAVGDQWIEQSVEAARTGQYGLQVLNSAEGSANSWDRGFKLANLPVKEGVPYRVTFWVRGPETGEGKLSSWMSVGMENFDKSFCTSGGTNYGKDQITLNGDWQRVSYLSVYHGKEAIKTVIDGQSWVGNAIFPVAFGGDSIETYKSHFGGYIPETFFFIVNLNSEGEYFLDDITIEENVAVAGVTFNDECVKIDFGFPTNIADLAKANGGPVVIDPSQLSVTQGGKPFNIEFLELHSDGYLYGFFPDGNGLDTETDEPVIVSFTPAEDCPIKYTDAQRRPCEADEVLGFEGEEAFVDYDIDAFSVAWSAPELTSITPENNSFNLRASDLQEITATFNKEVTLDYFTATLSWSDNFGDREREITDNATLSEDGQSIIISVPEDLEDNEYVLTLDGVANVMGLTMENPITVTYAIGLDNEASVAEVMYKSDFDNTPTNTLPKGWWSKNEDGLREYTVDGNGNPTGYGTGSRIFDGWSGDFKKAWYWCSRGTNEGYASFGEMVMDYLDADGQLDEAAFREAYPSIEPSEVSLYLTPRKYNVSFKMAAWKGTPVFRFKLVDKDDNVVAQFNDFTAKPNLNGGKGVVSGVLSLEVDFTVENEGYYVLKFEAQDAPWQEFMLADVQVITMPSKAAYYNGLLADAREKASVVVDDAFLEEELYGGASLDALDNEVEASKATTYHSPTEIFAEIAKLEELMNIQLTRMSNIDKYNSYIDQVKEDITALTDTKYAAVDVVTETQDIINNYGATNPATLSNEELAEVAPKLAAASTKLSYVQQCTDLLTYGIGQGLAAAELLQCEDFAAIDAADQAVSDDRAVAKLINDATKIALYKQIVAGTWNQEENLTETAVFETKLMPIETEDGEFEDWQNVRGDSVVGIELTGYVANPHLYRVYGNSGLPGWTIVGGAEDKSANVAYNDNNPNESEYVKDQYISSYGNVNFDISQAIEGLPVGKYVVTTKARTPLVDKLSDYGRMFYYNAQNDSTNVWDMFIYASTGEEPIITPFNGGDSGMGNANAALREITIGEDDVLTIGMHENYVSGVATKHETNESTSVWEGTVMADDVRLFFVAPLEGYDYAAALKDLETSLSVVKPNATVVEIYNVNGVRMNKTQKGVNILKMSNGKVVKVLVK